MPILQSRRVLFGFRIFATYRLTCCPATRAAKLITSTCAGAPYNFEVISTQETGEVEVSAFKSQVGSIQQPTGAPEAAP